MNYLKYLLVTGCVTFSLIIWGDNFPNYHRRHIGNIHKFSNEAVDEDKKRKNIASGLFDKVKDSLVIVNCGESTGSGFICVMDGKKWIITNEHVIHSGGTFEARAHSGQKYTIEDEDYIQVGANRDLVRILLKNDCSSALEIDDVPPQINDRLYTFGNSDGGQVMTSLNGTCMGMGSDTIEVSIPFVQGNSGGAILNEKGKVVGVVTYATKFNEPDNWIKNGTRFNEVRRYGVRFIDVKWELIKWSDFNIRAKAIAELNSYVNLLIPLCFSDGKLKLLSELKAKEESKFSVIKKFGHLIKNIARADEDAYKTYQKISRLEDEYKLIAKNEISSWRNKNGTPETQRRMNQKLQKIRYLLGDFDNKVIKVKKLRMNALKEGRDVAKKSPWKLFRLENEASKIASGLQFFIDRFEYYYKEDLKKGE